ncbi:MAG: HAD family hydrolase [Acidimicrobiales bacterium]
MIRAVTFDFWNTLVAERPDTWKQRRAAQLAVFERVGIERSPDEIEEAALAMRAWFDECWLANVVVGADDAATRLVAALDVVDDDGTVAVALADIYRAGGDPAELRLAPGIGDALESLVSLGVSLGIICDAGFTPGATLRTYLEHHGLLTHFSHWSFSDEVGVFKPDPAIFGHAAAGLGVTDGAELAHVGDLRRTDNAGARNVGWTAVRYRGLHDDAPPEGDEEVAHVVIDHHDQLIGSLPLD